MKGCKVLPVVNAVLRRVTLVPSVLWEKVPGREAPGRMSAAARIQMRPAVTLALATWAPVAVVLQLLSVAHRRVVQPAGRGGGGSLNPVGEGIAGPVQVVGDRRGAQGQAVDNGPLVVVRIVVPFPLRFHGRSVEGVVG